MRRTITKSGLVRLKAFGILLIFTFGELSPVLPFLDYFANYDYISKVLCINKDEPVKTCNGKCHLVQEIKNATSGEGTNPSVPLVQWERNVLILSSTTVLDLEEKIYELKQRTEFFSISIENLFYCPPTPPPKC